VGTNRQPDARIVNSLLDLRAFGSIATDQQRVAIEQAIRTQFGL
jgi:hypothetical protein